MLRETREQSLQGRLDISDRADRYQVATANVCAVGIDLDDLGLVRIELASREIAAKRQQHLAVENGMIARWSADHDAHSYIVRIVVLDKVLAARGVRHRGLKLRGQGDKLIMGALATGPGINGDRLAAVEQGRNLIEIGIRRTHHRAPRMDSIRRLVMSWGIGNIRRHDQHRNAMLRQCCLTGRNGLPPGLFGRQDHFAKHTAAFANVLECDLLDRLEANVLANDLGRDQDDRHRFADAVACLQPVYDRFTEGFGTADLIAADALLDQLCSR